MVETETEEEFLVGQSELYVSAAQAYREAHLRGACVNDCRSEAVKAIQILHPFLLKDEADKLANRIISQFSELYPGWLPQRVAAAK